MTDPNPSEFSDRQLLIQIHETVSGLAPLVRRHDVDLEGEGGQAGLKSRVVCLEKTCDDCAKREERSYVVHRDNRSIVAATIAAVAAIVACALQVKDYLAKLLSP